MRGVGEADEMSSLAFVWGLWTSVWSERALCLLGSNDLCTALPLSARSSPLCSTSSSSLFCSASVAARACPVPRDHGPAGALLQGEAKWV